MKKAMVLDTGNGQMCNQIQHLSYLISWALENDAQLIFPGTFKRYEGLRFSCDEVDSIIEIRGYNFLSLKWSVKILNKITKMLRSMHITFLSNVVNFWISDKMPEVKDGKNAYLIGWGLVDDDDLSKNAEIIRNFFSPDEELVLKMKSKYHFKDDVHYIGVHMRRGDYKNWKNGKYFLEDEVYIRYMHDYFNYFSNKKICFMLFSNEDINLDVFKSDKYDVIKCTGSGMEDFVTMMQLCKAIIGPPSTYSGMASFLGGISKFVVDNEDRKIDFKKAQIVHIDIDDYGATLN